MFFPLNILKLNIKIKIKTKFFVVDISTVLYNLKRRTRKLFSLSKKGFLVLQKEMKIRKTLAP